MLQDDHRPVHASSPYFPCATPPVDGSGLEAEASGDAQEHRRTNPGTTCLCAGRLRARGRFRLRRVVPGTPDRNRTFPSFSHAAYLDPQEGDRDPNWESILRSGARLSQRSPTTRVREGRCACASTGTNHSGARAGSVTGPRSSARGASHAPASRRPQSAGLQRFQLVSGDSMKRKLNADTATVSRLHSRKSSKGDSSPVSRRK